ncbi:nitrous oxide reductase accessory protein NosL [Phycisphaeraceae bacterium AH-315-B13]|nr:nitrous oxide reductase accessory protein NosL [Phycisphaeraceae bacterium AH-315-B13]
MNNKAATLPLLALACIASSGCTDHEAGGPPTILLGESMCIECGMILSDERFATVTIYEGYRGAEPRLFDDFNCQVIYEAEHPDETILTRWSHDYLTVEWIDTEQAFFVKSSTIHAPMGSQIAAFATEAAAAGFDDALQTDPMTHTEMVRTILE